MAYEIPLDLIKELQISLRKQANLSSYDPDDPSLPNLPSLDESIAELDPSPPYLRCKHCKGRLLRGLKSFICVFCGTEQNTELPPDPINFKNTIACRWFLESLELDGSEMVGPPIDSKKLDRGKLPEQFPLTDLLDLEIRWPPVSEKKGISLSNETLVPSKSPLSLDGVDLDSYFTEEKKDTTSKLSEEPSALNKQVDASENKGFQDNVDLSLFGDVQSSETTTTTTKHEDDDSFSDWEASFQSASAATLHDNSKSTDPFDVSVVNIPSSKSGEVEDDKNVSSSMTNDWFERQDDLWSNSVRGTSGIPEQIEQTGNVMDGRTKENADSSSSVSVDWFQDDQWQRGIKKEPDDKYDDSGDAWDNFTRSTSAQVPFDNSRKDIVNEVVPNVNDVSEIDFFSSATSKDNNFRNYDLPNSFAEAFAHPNSSVEEKVTQSEASELNRMNKENKKTGENSEGTAQSLGLSGISSNSDDDVQMLMAKMHDLSFMLENHLSIPPK